MEKCTCEDWESNIKKINNMISMQANMAWGNKDGWDGMFFKFCPWCGKKLIEVEDGK